MNLGFNKQPGQGVSIDHKTFSSKVELIADKFKQWLQKKDIGIETLNTPEVAGEYLLKSHLLMPGVTLEEVIAELKNQGFFRVVLQKKKIEEPKEKEIIETHYDKLPGVTTIENEALKKQLEENKFFETLEKDVFKNDKDLDLIYLKALSLVENKISEKNEDIEHYLDFVKKGLVSEKEARENFQELVSLKEKFETLRKTLGDVMASNLDKNKKIATIIECGVAYGVSELGWYGSNVFVEKTSEFDDVKRGTDDILEIRKGKDESNFMGLGIDVTYRGLYSEKYKEKLFKLLKSIIEGHKTKIKYFKNHDGTPMKEFAVPKIILFFNIDDVKDMVRMIKNIDDPKVKEEFRNSPQKYTVMNQMLIQCEMLAKFAERYQNDIFRKYIDIVNSIKELSWENPEIQKIREARHEDEASIQMKFLISEFEEMSKNR